MIICAAGGGQSSAQAGGQAPSAPADSSSATPSCSAPDANGQATKRSPKATSQQQDREPGTEPGAKRQKNSSTPDAAHCSQQRYQTDMLHTGSLERQQAGATSEGPRAGELQVQWQPRLAVQASAKPEPREVPLTVRTTANKAYWEQHKHNAGIFNSGLVGSAEQPMSVPVAAVDMAVNSCWFQVRAAHLTCCQTVFAASVHARAMPCTTAHAAIDSNISILHVTARLVSCFTYK